MAKKKNKTENSSFEESISQLSEIVRELEEGKLSLDDSLAHYEQGVRYLKQCQKILSTAERKIETLSGFDADGNPITQRVDDEELTLQEKADQRSRRRTARPKKATAAKSAVEGEISLDDDDVDADATLF